MTWLVLSHITQKIHSVSEIRSSLDAKQQHLSPNLLSTTDFQMLDNNPSVQELSLLEPKKYCIFCP